MTVGERVFRALSTDHAAELARRRGNDPPVTFDLFGCARREKRHHRDDLVVRDDRYGKRRAKADEPERRHLHEARVTVDIAHEQRRARIANPPREPLPR